MPNAQNFNIVDLPSDFQKETTFSFNEEEMSQFSILSGDNNLIHTETTYAQEKGFQSRVVYGALLVAKISKFIGMQLPGQNVLWLYNNIDFKSPVYIHDIVTMKVCIKMLSEATQLIEFSFKMFVEDKIVAKGKFGVKVI